MKALSLIYRSEEIAVRALNAGHDLLLYGDHIAPHVDEILRLHIPQAFEAIRQGCKEGSIPMESLNRHVRKILKAKEDLGLFENRTLPPLEDLNDQAALELKEKLSTSFYNGSSFQRPPLQ
jgi:beta-glucosidase-like glycosyl hydrolase